MAKQGLAVSLILGVTLGVGIALGPTEVMAQKPNSNSGDKGVGFEGLLSGAARNQQARDEACYAQTDAFAQCQQNNYSYATITSKIPAQIDKVIPTSAKTSTQQVSCGQIWTQIQAKCSDSSIIQDYRDSKKDCTDAIKDRGKSLAKIQSNKACLKESQQCSAMTQQIAAAGVDLSNKQWAQSINPQTGVAWGAMYYKACPAASLENSKAQKGALSAIDKKMSEITKDLQKAGDDLIRISSDENDYKTKAEADKDEANGRLDKAQLQAASELTKIKNEYQQTKNDFTDKIAAANLELDKIKTEGLDETNKVYDEAMTEAANYCSDKAKTEAKAQVAILKSMTKNNKSLDPSLLAYMQNVRQKNLSKDEIFRSWILQNCYGSSEYLNMQRRAAQNQRSAQIKANNAITKAQNEIDSLKRQADTAEESALKNQQVAMLSAQNEYAAALRQLNSIDARHNRELGLITDRRNQVIQQMNTLKAQQTQLTAAKQMICSNPTYQGTDIPNDPHCSSESMGALGDIVIPDNMANTVSQCTKSDYDKADEAYYTGFSEVQSAQSQCCGNSIFQLDSSMSGILQNAGCKQDPRMIMQQYMGNQ